MRFNFQWPPALMYCTTLIVLGVLVFFGKLHPEALLAQLTWLAPSPLQTNPFQAKAQAERDSASRLNGKNNADKPETD